MDCSANETHEIATTLPGLGKHPVVHPAFLVRQLELMDGRRLLWQGNLATQLYRLLTYLTDFIPLVFTKKIFLYLFIMYSGYKKEIFRDPISSLYADFSVLFCYFDKYMYLPVVCRRSMSVSWSSSAAASSPAR